MASEEPFAHLLKVTGEAVEEVLDSYRDYYSHPTYVDSHQIIKDIKVLLQNVQKLETESSTGAFRATSQRAKNNIIEVLNECGQLAKLLQIRIGARILQEDARISREVETCCAEIEFFLRTYGRSRDNATTSFGRAEQHELDTLMRRYETAQVEIATLKSIIDGHRDSPNAVHDGFPQECYCEARLSHIKRLHEAITCLGLRHPRDHHLESWEDLKGELPHMLDHLRGMNDQLKLLDNFAKSPSTKPLRAPTTHRRYKSESQNIDETPRNVYRRMPSPAESNISVPRGSSSNVDVSDRSRKQKSRGSGYFSNQGGGIW